MSSNRDPDKRGRHRRPRRLRTARRIRGGVLSGVVSTVAVSAGSAAPAHATANPSETTAELRLDSVLGAGTARATEATHDYIDETEREHRQVEAATAAQQTAAKRRAQAARRAAAAEARRRAEQRHLAEAASRADARPTLTSLGASRTDTVRDFARAQVGDGYYLGATGPDVWDCSGLTQAAFATVDVTLPRTAAAQSALGVQVSLDALRAGDLLYWGSRGNAYHVAIYNGDGTFTGAQNSATGVVERDLSWDPPTGAVRFL